MAKAACRNGEPRDIGSRLTWSTVMSWVSACEEEERPSWFYHAWFRKEGAGPRSKQYQHQFRPSRGSMVDVLFGFSFTYLSYNFSRLFLLFWSADCPLSEIAFLFAMLSPSRCFHIPVSLKNKEKCPHPVDVDKEMQLATRSHPPLHISSSWIPTQSNTGTSKISTSPSNRRH